MLPEQGDGIGHAPIGKDLPLQAVERRHKLREVRNMQLCAGFRAFFAHHGLDPRALLIERNVAAGL